MEIKGSGTNFLRIYDEFVSKLGLSWNRPAELATYALIFSFNVRGQQAHFSFRYLSSRLGITRQSAINAINSLVTKGKISKYQTEDLNKLDGKNSYVISIEALRDAKAFDLVELMADPNPNPGKPLKPREGVSSSPLANQSQAEEEGNEKATVKAGVGEKTYVHLTPKDPIFKKYFFFWKTDPTRSIHIDLPNLKKDAEAFKSYAHWNYLIQDRKANLGIVVKDTDQLNGLKVELADLESKMESAKKDTQTLLKLIAEREAIRIKVKELETAIAGAKDKANLDEYNAKREGVPLND